MDTLNEMSRCTELNLNRIAEEMEAKFDFVEENQEMKKENNAKGKKVRQDTDATRGLVTRAKLLKAKDSIAKHENSLAIQGAALKEKKILDDTQNDRIELPWAELRILHQAAGYSVDQIKKFELAENKKEKKKGASK